MLIYPLVFKKELGLETPVSAFLKLRTTGNVVLLESSGGSPSLTEFSFLGVEPLTELVFRNHQADVRELDTFYTLSGNPFAILRSLLKKYQFVHDIKAPFPFWGGAMGFLSYDAGRYIERLPSTAQDDLMLPEAHFIIPSVLLVFDHRQKYLYVVINQVVKNSEEARLSAETRLREVLEKLEKKTPPLSKLPAKDCSLSKKEGFESNFSPSGFEEAVEKIKEYVRAGDVYQVNLSQRLKIPFEACPFSLYLKLREINPSPFGGFLDFGDYQLISSSPERLIVLRDGIAQTRPIAGTRRRGEGIFEDELLSSDLILNPKERAEHIMLVDLERNDLGRVCDYGAVKVSEMMTLEKYSHVIHIVSNVGGKLHKGKDQIDLIKAMFPGGTITGCPKVRCMEIIEELEPTRRGPYTGSMGYFGFNGNMDMNIIIRTFVVKEKNAYVQVGAGIVYDSQPKREYFETLSKAEALLKAVGINLRRVEWEKLSM